MAGQGHDGADGIYVSSNIHCNGGGGGAGSPGGNGDNSCTSSNQGNSDGGDGLLSNITGAMTWYAG